MSLAKRNEKVRTEQKRLMAQFSDIPPNKKSTFDRASFLPAELVKS